MKIYKFATMTFKQLKSKLLAIVSLGIIFYAGIGTANAQCTPTFSGNTCVGDGITFFSNTPGATNIEWDFGDGTKDLTNKKSVTHNYNAAGTYTITLKLKYGAGTPCTSTILITVYDKPTANLTLINNPKQCFENNSFCFTDNSSAIVGGNIISVKYLFDDGELITQNNPTFPRSFCKSFTNRSGGTYGVTIELVDINGCVRKVYYKNIMTVHPKISPKFTSNFPKGCGSVTIKLCNKTPIAQANVKSFKWILGNGTTNTTNWGNPNCFSYTYTTQGPNNGNFNGALIINTTFGCSDTFRLGAMATNFILDPKIMSDKDSSCVSQPEFKFWVENNGVRGGVPGVPPGSYLWNFNDNCMDIPNNFNNRTWFPAHTFTTGPRSFLVALNFKHPVCPAKTVYKEVMILGPVSTIEVANNRVLENETYQCQGDKPVHFPNNSTFYHNDNNFYDDDSSLFTNGKMHHIFDSTACASDVNAPRPGALESLKPEIRNNFNVLRLWDFGDNDAPRCTTDTRLGINVGVNCNFSKDSLPVHKYSSWDSSYTFKRAGRPYSKSVFIENLDTCKGQIGGPCYVDTCFSINIFADDTTCKIVQKFTVHGSGTDAVTLSNSSPYNSYTKINRGIDFEKGPMEKLMMYPSTFKLNAGIKLLRKKKNTNVWITINGPTTITIPKDDTIKMALGDSAQYLADSFILERTADKINIPDSLTQYITTCTRNANIQPGDSISAAHHRQLFYERDVRCFTVTLLHRDTIHPLHCESTATKQIAHGKGVPKKMSTEGGGPTCLFSPTQDYKTLFKMADTKPGCTQQHLWMNFDSATNPNNWIDFKNIIMGTTSAKSGGIAYKKIAPYQKGGNYPNTYNKTYRAADIKDKKNGRVTIGLIIGNGTDDKGNPMCIDTVWYKQELKFPILDATYNIVIPKEHDNSDGAFVSHICVGDTVMCKIPPIANLTNPDHVDIIFWKFFTLSAGPNLTDQHEIEVIEEIERMKFINGDKSHRYNYIISTRNIRSQIGNKPSDNTTDPDTMLTAKYSKWFKIAHYDKVYDEIKEALKDNNFDIYELTGREIAKMIGKKTCIDTTGFGQYIDYTFEPDTTGPYTIYNRRDSTIYPNDSFQLVLKDVNGKDSLGYRDSVMVFKTKVAGQYRAELKLEGKGCEVFLQRKVNVGFWQKLEIAGGDSVVCHNTIPKAIVNYRYWEKDPDNSLNIPPQLDPIDYWRDRQRILDGDKEEEPKWDWSIADDDTLNPKTIFGTPDHGAVGIGLVGTNFDEKDLGGGNLYYKKYGVYYFRVATKDTMGCRDTIGKRVYITDLKAKFNLDLKLLNCKSIVELFDSSKIFDPCQDSFNFSCDKIVRWEIDWGDGKRKSNFYPFKPAKIGHDYTRNGTFEIKLKVTSELGCVDSTTLIIKVPGPQPEFEFATTNKICAEQFVKFVNTSIDPSDTATWLWNFGDGETRTQSFAELGDTITHYYQKPGTYDVFLTEFDYLPGTNKQCPGIYPDTIEGGQAIIQIFVKAWDSIDIIADNENICPDDSITFTATPYGARDSAYKSYNWSFEQPDGTFDKTNTIDSITGYKFKKTIYGGGGDFWIHVRPIELDSVPLPHCPGRDSVRIYIDSVRAEFSIDSSDIPRYCFKDASVNANEVSYDYFKNGSLYGGSKDRNPCEKFDTGTYTICQYVASAGGCLDTFCLDFTYIFTKSVKLYNVFTPGLAGAGTDGTNDVYDVEIFGHNLYELKIFNRWNQLVFESTDENNDWNGKINNDGAICPEGTYYVQFKYRMKDEEEDEIHTVTGSVTLLREGK